MNLCPSHRFSYSLEWENASAYMLVGVEHWLDHFPHEHISHNAKNCLWWNTHKIGRMVIMPVFFVLRNSYLIDSCSASRLKINRSHVRINALKAPPKSLIAHCPLVLLRSWLIRSLLNKEDMVSIRLKFGQCDSHSVRRCRRRPLNHSRVECGVGISTLSFRKSLLSLDECNGESVSINALNVSLSLFRDNVMKFSRLRSFVPPMNNMRC